jgi:hypothetical protein
MMPALQNMIQEACEYGPAVEFRNNYSGRGMFGQQCVAIVGHRQSCQQLVATVIKEMSLWLSPGICTDHTEQQFEQYLEQIMCYDQDTMGWDVVLYWPDLTTIPDAEQN